ncbi:His-Xaa-Ser repeat protein HxsA [Hoeflea sp. WL0058]|uniref:His-Xaa-Ser repeat protein HxsA n=1 Tax=Flavimaribacter sediminis TaxID=2865987 RepID=A0AAE3D3B9_9HYPH|nr:His-Xaa-Ser repeat protein HxsA [Flavimaribacter sediminis]MBW8639997.1 His-Xaa-Ser repeat protein HxsA [Flavimaribacter sediminis]
MRKRVFAIPSLLAAGFVSPGAQAAIPDGAKSKQFDDPIIDQRLRLNHKYHLAAHRSHSSHRSHGSHRSSSGGGYSVPRTTTPVPQSDSTPPSSILPSTPKAAPKTLPGNTPKFRQIVMQVQLALQAFGYYNGTIDGIIGRESKAALASFQRDHGLKVTGTVTAEVLDVFGIKAE